MKTEKNSTEQELLQQRLSGILPVIKIVDDLFTVDWKLRELRAKDAGAPATINMNNMTMDEHDLNYVGYYHVPSKSLVKIDLKKITAMPEDTVLLKIPNELKMDPVQVAREYGMEDTYLLNVYPLSPDLQAKAIPLEDTVVPKIIKQNLDRIHGKKNRWGRKKGKGL